MSWAQALNPHISQLIEGSTIVKYNQSFNNISNTSFLMASFASMGRKLVGGSTKDKDAKGSSQLKLNNRRYNFYIVLTFYFV